MTILLIILIDNSLNSRIILTLFQVVVFIFFFATKIFYFATKFLELVANLQQFFFLVSSPGFSLNQKICLQKINANSA